MTDYATLTAYVARGAEFLDDIRPGWRADINLGSLDQSHGVDCVLGQLFGHYSTALSTLDMSSERACSYGFNSRAHGSRWTDENETLTALWTDLLTENAPYSTEASYTEAVLLTLLDKGVSHAEFSAYIKVAGILSNI